ncbi:unnamed protein product [Trypanosoma congolense IL3000]|uniref:WGS project CAEQ00000000 data, annotated contig 269 n=1 Tax=Trypanosoma congolense (strain IL3000) TaxID=1068625 RepID=F9WEH6_TRYCI|nr:unnamed protein product [Trypanosoma congolense IL3000]
MERLTQETCFAYTEAVAVLQQLCYDEYVSLVRSLLSVTRSSLGFVGGSDLRPPHAYMDAVAALDGRLNAVRTKEVDLENVIRDLERVQKERDEELVALRTNFLRSREAWEGDLEVLAVKLKALQGTSGKNIIILPDSEAAMSAIREIFDCEEGECGENKQELPQVRGDSRHDINKYNCEAGCSYENNEVIRQWATRLACGGGKKCDHTAAYRLERFFRWVLENVVPIYSNTSSICVLEHIIHALSNHMVLLRKIRALTASGEETEEGEGTSSMYSKDACRALEELYESNRRIQEILKTHGSEDTAHARNDDKKKFYRLEQKIVQLKKESRILHGIYSEFNANEGNIITCVQEIRNNNEQLRKIKEITGTDAISFIMTNKTNLETTTEAIHKYLATEAYRNNNQQGTREANHHDETENIRRAHKIIKAAAQTLIGHEKEKDIQAQETKERLKIIHGYYDQHPNNQSSTAVITKNYLVNITSTRNKKPPTTNEEIQERKRSLPTLLRKRIRGR